MALRLGGGAGRGRARGRRAGFVGLALGLSLAAGLLAAGPALRDADDRFLARGELAGDHLQTGYNLWLVGHQLGRAEAPWLDPYSFQPEAEPTVNYQGWLLGLPYWPLHAVFGDVVAWNLVVLLSVVLAGGLAVAWLRELGLWRGAALVGGFAFALAPYLTAQRSAGHLLGLVAFLLPLALWGVERRNHAVVAAALVAVPLSGQTHLALAAIPLVVGYALVRGRGGWGAAAGAVTGIAAGLLVRVVTIEGSIAEGGRTLRAINFYSADWQDFLSRGLRHDLEQFVFLGWATPLLGLVGLALVLRARRYALASVLGLALAVPVMLAFGTNLPVYELLYDALPPLRYPRVPERLLPVAVLALAGLVAFAVDRWRHPVVAALAVVLLAVDLQVRLFEPAPRVHADVYVAMAEGRLLELPVFAPDRHWGSVYLQASTRSPRERPGGYSTVAPVRADSVAQTLQPLNCGRWSTPRARLLAALDVRYVAVHRELFADTPLVPRQCADVAERELGRHGWELVRRDARIALYEPVAPAQLARLPEGTLERCRSSQRLRAACPPLVPLSEEPYLTRLVAGQSRLDAFILGEGEIVVRGGPIRAAAGAEATLRDGLVGSGPRQFGARRWGGLSGSLALDRDGLLVFRWQEHSIGLRAREPLTRTAATLEAVVESLR